MIIPHDTVLSISKESLGTIILIVIILFFFCGIFFKRTLDQLDSHSVEIDKLKEKVASNQKIKDVENRLRENIKDIESRLLENIKEIKNEFRFLEDRIDTKLIKLNDNLIGAIKNE